MHEYGERKTTRIMMETYVTWLPVRDLRNFRPLDFCWTEGTWSLRSSSMKGGVSWRTDWPLQMGPIRSPETLVTSYQHVLRNIQEERRFSTKRTEIFTKCATHFLPILTRLELSWQILIKLPRTKCHEDLPREREIVACGSMDMTNLTVPFHNFANAPKMIYKSWQVVMAYFKVPLQQPSE
jgi:hypothetical protein